MTEPHFALVVMRQPVRQWLPSGTLPDGPDLPGSPVRREDRVANHVYHMQGLVFSTGSP